MPRPLFAFLIALTVTPALAQTPVADRTGVEVQQVAVIPQTNNQHPIRIAQNPVDGLLYVLATSGRLYRLNPLRFGGFLPEEALTEADHGTPGAVGMAFAADGSLYLLGNDNVGSTQTRFVIRQGSPRYGSWNWSTVAESEPYLLSHTWFDHKANGLALSLDQSTLYVNSGARTDHGEMYGGIREEGLTALVLQIPATAVDLTLPNDRQALKDGGYVFAEGIRNSFDLELSPDGDLFGTENAGDRDDSEELNWIREGRHYGFPWRIGTSVTPQQFPGYDPGADPFVQPDRNTNNQADIGWYFSNDPTFPPPPEGVTFTDPIPNAGPFADHFRDPVTGAVVDASDTGATIGTFTSHRSPLGLVFDADSVLIGELRGGGFMMSWNDDGDQLLSRLGGAGGDLIHLGLDKSSGSYSAAATRIAHNFDHPIDAVMVQDVIYVIEYGNPGNGGRRSVQAVSFPSSVGIAEEPVHPRATPRLSAYPNPTSGTVRLDYSGLPPNANVQVQLVDVLGRVVRTIDTNSLLGGLSVSTEGLPAGVYLTLVRSGSVQISQPVTVLR
jgi:Secretion system C-terminal sorting domain